MGPYAHETKHALACQPSNTIEPPLLEMSAFARPARPTVRAGFGAAFGHAHNAVSNAERAGRSL